MAVEATSYWMDRVRAVPAQTKRHRIVALVNTETQDSRALIAARSALRGREGISQDALHLLASDRRREKLKAGRPARLLLAGGLLVSAAAVCIAGSTLANQAVLMAGFGIGLLGLIAAATVLASLMDPQVGDLADFVQADETPATAEDIAALSRAAQADVELDKLIAHWWKDSGAPIRQEDLALVRDFQRAKHGS